MAIGKEGNIKWVDGLRGLASLLVVIPHILRDYDLWIFFASNNADSSPRLIQLPFLRVFPQGRLGVAIFSFVTGYVCALKPIKLIRQGDQTAAFKSISSSALRRIPRLALPTALSGLIVWALAQLGCFEVARRADAPWSSSTAARRAGSLGEAVGDAEWAVLSPWIREQYDHFYEPNHWNLWKLLKGSMITYVFILATSFVRSGWRMGASLALALAYYVSTKEAQFGVLFAWGVFLCELQQLPIATNFVTAHPHTSRLLSLTLVLLGLYIGSFPEGDPNWQPWSAALDKFLWSIIPAGDEPPRYSSAICLMLLTLGIHFSEFLKHNVLSSWPLLWLGKVSFAVYLLHGGLIRWLLCWLVFGPFLPPDVKNDEGDMVPGMLPRPGWGRVGVALAIWFPVVYSLAWCWMRWVDPWCARVTERLVGVIRVDEASEKPLPSYSPRNEKGGENGWGRKGP